MSQQKNPIYKITSASSLIITRKLLLWISWKNSRLVSLYQNKTFRGLTLGGKFGTNKCDVSHKLSLSCKVNMGPGEYLKACNFIGFKSMEVFYFSMNFIKLTYMYNLNTLTHVLMGDQGPLYLN